jgi:hypothetical protein
MITIDNIDTISELTIDQLCDELYRLESLDSKRLQNLYLISVLSHNITERLKNHVKH